MVLTNAQTTAFFENASQMAIPHATVLKLNNEGIETPMDLSEFDKTSICQIADNLRQPGGRVTDPDDPDLTIPTPPFVFGAKSQQRLLVACNMIRYYEMIGRTILAQNIKWTPTMKNFKPLWQAIVDRKELKNPDTPIITKTLPIMKWVEAFVDHLHRCTGTRFIPLAYVIRDAVEVDPVCPPLKEHQPYTELYGSVEEDMIARASHNAGLFSNDNASVYYKLEEATRSTTYAASIAPFQKKKNGRDAFLALVAQYAGNDKWDSELKKQDNILHTRKWKGHKNFPLEKFIQLHWTAFVTMTSCIKHVAFQLPNEHTRVGYVPDAIENDDAQLQAAIARVEDDTDKSTGKRNDFALMAAYILPKDPVLKRRLTAEKRSVAEISATDAGEQVQGQRPKMGNKQGKGKKVGIGTTGVHLRYHTPAEYSTLKPPQRKELSEWRTSLPEGQKKQKKQRRDVSISVAVASQVKAELAKRDEETNPAPATTTSKAAVKAFIMSAFEESKATPAKRTTFQTPGNVSALELDIPTEIDISGNAATSNTVTLATILKQAKLSE